MKGRSQSSSTQIRRSKRSRKQTTEHWSRASVLRELKRFANPPVRAKMSYFGVKVPKAYGISQPMLHALARRIGKNHKLAEQLWCSGIHEARILATLVGEAGEVTARQMERWTRKFDSWDVVDAACCYLFAGASSAWRQVGGLEQQARRICQARGFFSGSVLELQG